MSKEERILEYIRQNGNISTQKVMDLCNYKSRTGARNLKVTSRWSLIYDK